MTGNQLPFAKLIRRDVVVWMTAWLSVAVGPTWSSTAAATTPSPPIQTRAPSGQLDAEARLLEVYRLMGIGGARAALEASEKLVKDYPTFQLAQLVYGDLLSARVKPVRMLGDVPTELNQAAQKTLEDLRAESQLRVTAVRGRPALGSVPAQFVGLSRATSTPSPSTCPKRGFTSSRTPAVVSGWSLTTTCLWAKPASTKA